MRGKKIRCGLYSFDLSFSGNWSIIPYTVRNFASDSLINSKYKRLIQNIGKRSTIEYNFNVFFKLIKFFIAADKI